jgi:DNA gyrase subunit A
MTTKAEDILSHVFVASAHAYLMIFSDKGQVYTLKVHEVPDASTSGKGKAIVNLINLPPGDKVAGIMPVREFSKGRYVIMVTRHGIVKKTELSEYAFSRAKGILAIHIEEDDELITVQLSDGNQKIFIATHDGRAIYFDESDTRPMGRQARGVRGITLREGDYVIGMAVVGGTEQMLSISETGLGKRTPITEYRHQSRGGSGVINMKLTERTGPVVAVMPVQDEDEVLIITSQGQIIRLRTEDIRETSRSAQGVKLIETSEENSVVSASLVRQDEKIIDATLPVN